MDFSTSAKRSWGTDDPTAIVRMYAEYMKPGRWRPQPDIKHLQLPYYAQDESLPPIPTPEEIDDALFSDPRNHFGPGDVKRNVLRVKSVYAVKIGGSTIAQEAENLFFLQEQNVTGLRLPKLYAVFHHQGADPTGRYRRRPQMYPDRSKWKAYYYLIMSYIEGESISEEFWGSIDREAQLKVYRKLGEQVELLRSIKPPHPNYYGRVYDQPLRVDCPYTNYATFEFFGPFHSYEAFFEQMLKTWERRILYHASFSRARGLTLDNVLDSKGMPIFDPEVQKAAVCFLRNVGNKDSVADRSVLTQSDFNAGNIMLVQPKSGPFAYSKRKEEWDVHLVDWERMAWLPAWTEIDRALLYTPACLLGDGFPTWGSLEWTLIAIFAGESSCTFRKAKWYATVDREFLTSQEILKHNRKSSFD
ncbi:hypothetical protein BU24DRAFT_494382 [Aaosphaeria arxii CBS 175.79]|uniref:Aminoglycoside phosphotransferase domain-containing protein n=1 Tax=Aaosphaeria arxii CBS 175.79 TaxID=1450172 RepID=A0A6A5XMF8_9PLEO|nr:uncharacterized protein BU24DRAFT_494382 [Aaosphaeria arxii CBS 175.79]KAF2014027.1 hypothetical protein BU24DRAFT_494382 [Aaosphaeria arxii CBS 175.79]